MLLLTQGSEGPHVRRLQLLLNSKILPCPNLPPDGRFGPRTREALQKFQRANGLTADGACGAQTWQALDQKESPRDPKIYGGPDLWMKIAIAELGVHENATPGKHSQRILEYHSCTKLRATTDEVPWCSSFVNWVMKQAGKKGTESALAASWLNWGQELKTSRVGAVTVIKKKGATSDPATGSGTGNHVGFFVSASSTSIRLLGGNQGDAVRYTSFGIGAYEIRGYRWPA